MKKIRVLVADDHALMRMGLTTLFKTDPALAVVGEAEDGRQAIDKTAEAQPDIVVLDLMARQHQELFRHSFQQARRLLPRRSRRHRAQEAPAEDLIAVTPPP